MLKLNIIELLRFCVDVVTLSLPSLKYKSPQDYLSNSADKSISFRYSGGGALGGDKLSNKIKKYTQDPDNWWVNNLIIEFEVCKKRIYQWSPRTSKLEKWANNLILDFENDFNWQDYRKALDNNL